MTRPLRKDAAVRRSALLAAARAVFAEEGIEAPLDRIAERAGVGRATLYRNFPGRTEIALAVLMDEVESLAARYAEPRDANAFFDFLTELSERLERNSALAGVLAVTSAPELLRPLRRALVAAGTPALERSQRAGVVRPEVAPEDLRLLAAMLGAGQNNAAPDERRALAARALRFVLAAVRATS